MNGVLLALLLAVSPTRTGDVEAALASGDFASAWDLAEAEEDPLERARWRTEIFYRGGNPSGALEAARVGLQQDPGHLVLLFRAAGAALWLQDPGASASYSRRLQDAVHASERLSPEEREQWLAVAQDFTTRTSRLEQHDRERDHAVSRARWISAAGLCALLAVIGLGARQGRSSSPVS